MSSKSSLKNWEQTMACVSMKIVSTNVAIFQWNWCSMEVKFDLKIHLQQQQLLVIAK